MSKKIIIAIMTLTLLIGAYGVVGCAGEETKKSSEKVSKDVKETDNEKVNPKNGGLAMPALFDKVGYEVYEGDIVEGFDYRDEPTLGDVIIETAGTVNEVADHARKQLKEIGATIVEDDDTEESEDRVRVSALFVGKDGTAYTFNVKIAAGQDTDNIWVGYTIQTAKAE